MVVLLVTSLILWCLLLRANRRAYHPIGEEGRRCGGGACLFCCIGGCDCRVGGGDDDDEGGDGDGDGGGARGGGGGGGAGDGGGDANNSIELARQQRNN